MGPMSDAQEIREAAREVIEVEARAVRAMLDAVDERFERACRMILACRGAVLTSGVGKAGHIARKLAASFSSTGTPAHFLNPAEALHGDVGAVREDDIVLALSYSGQTDEILGMVSVVKKLGAPLIAMTASDATPLAKAADVTLRMGPVEEACPLRLAPSASTTAMLALGDALLLTVMKLRRFTAEQFALYHPAGQLGRKLLKVREAMTFRKGENLPLASDRLSVGQVLHEVSHIKRRSGAVVLVDDEGRLSGLFTDADLRRLITSGVRDALQRPIAQVMTHNPRSLHGDQLASEAVALMRQFRFDEWPVIDDDRRPIGLIDVQDLVVLRMFDAGG